MINACMAQHNTMNALKIELKSLPDLMDGLSKIQRLLGAVCQRIDEVEDLLTQRMAEDAAMELAHWKADQHDITEEYRVAKRYQRQLLYHPTLTFS
jgi:hypothetical protein